MKRSTCILAALIAAVCIASTANPAQAQRPQSGLNLTEFDRLFNEPPRVEVNVRGSLLRLVVEAARDEDPALAQMLSRLEAVQVRTYNLGAENRSAVEREASRMGGELGRRGWERVVRVRDHNDNVDIFMSESNDVISGLVVMVLSGNEATFVNIVGEIDPAEVGMIGRKFNIGSISNGLHYQPDRTE